MIRRVRVAEVRAVLALLEADSDDVEELAREIVRTINRLRAAEPVWVRVVRVGTGYVLYGPYGAAEAARKDRQSVGPSLDVTADDIRLFRLVPPWGGADE